MKPGFVDCHSHVVPSGDDGASSVEDGLAIRASGDAGATELARSYGISRQQVYNIRWRRSWAEV